MNKYLCTGWSCMGVREERALPAFHSFSLARYAVSIWFSPGKMRLPGLLAALIQEELLYLNMLSTKLNMNFPQATRSSSQAAFSAACSWQRELLGA